MEQDTFVKIKDKDIIGIVMIPSQPKIKILKNFSVAEYNSLNNVLTIDGNTIAIEDDRLEVIDEPRKNKKQNK